MPHKRSVWQTRIKDVERENQAVRIGLDLLAGADPEEIRDLASERGWNEVAPRDLYAAERNLAATYVIRMYSVFERAVGSFWKQFPENAGRDADGRMMIEEVGDIQFVPDDIIRAAQAVRSHRNDLVHQQIERHAGLIEVDAASRDLLSFLERLPDAWN